MKRKPLKKGRKKNATPSEKVALIASILSIISSLIAIVVAILTLLGSN